MAQTKWQIFLFDRCFFRVKNKICLFVLVSSWHLVSEQQTWSCLCGSDLVSHALSAKDRFGRPFALISSDIVDTFLFRSWSDYIRTSRDKHTANQEYYYQLCLYWKMDHIEVAAVAVFTPQLSTCFLITMKKQWCPLLKLEDGGSDVSLNSAQALNTFRTDQDIKKDQRQIAQMLIFPIDSLLWKLFRINRSKKSV